MSVGINGGPASAFDGAGRLDGFLNTSAAAIAERQKKHGSKYPRVPTKSCNRSEFLLPQQPVVDRNAHLFAGVTPGRPVLRWGY